MAKILFLGEIGQGQTSLMRLRALERLGHEVCGVHTTESWTQASWLQWQVQWRLQRGSIPEKINRSVIEATHDFRPRRRVGRKSRSTCAATQENLRALGPRLVHFTPDPYFCLDWKRTPLMDEAIGTKVYKKAQHVTLGMPFISVPLGNRGEVHRRLAPSLESRND